MKPPVSQPAEETALKAVQCEFESHLGDQDLPYPNHKVYGPYLRNDGRRHVVLVGPSNTKKTVSWPRFKLERQLKRKLTVFEEVHHIDGNYQNDSDENLQIVKWHEHRKIHKGQDQEFTCPVCGKMFVLTSMQISVRRTNIKLGRIKTQTGPFCSKRCNGKVNH